MFELTKIPESARFHHPDENRFALREFCQDYPDVMRRHLIGHSEEDRPIDGFVLGNGPIRVSLIAGAHSDEPVGPETLRFFISSAIRADGTIVPELKPFQFVIVPHVNPDGAYRNWTWIEQWPDLAAYLKLKLREPPGRDVEFGFPKMRPENRAVSRFLQEFGPFHLHLSLHGMGFSDGVLLLIEKEWIGRTEDLREHFQNLARSYGFRLHDHDRGGEKGFHYIGPGFTTTPRGQAMRDHFFTQNDPETARLFHDSSMEFVRKLGGDPLCLVTELPLFMIRKPIPNPTPGVPAGYLAFKDVLPDLQLKVARGESIARTIEEFQIEPLPLHIAIRLQLQVIQLGLETIAASIT